MDASLTDRVEELAEEIAGQARTVEDLNGLLQQLMKTALQRMLDTELEVHLGRRGGGDEVAGRETEADGTMVTASLTDSARAVKNRRNGYSPKTVQGTSGELRLDIPRDRQGTFEPLVIPKHQRRIPGFDEKILALYAKGMTTRDIQDILQQLYGVEVSPTLVSEITADLDQHVTAWRTRPLEGVWPIVYFDGIMIHVRSENGRVLQHAMYVALGVNLAGKKELLGLWLAEHEGAKFWLTCLTDLKNRGLKDIFVACIDGLTGFPDAIHAAYPDTKVQLCVVHLMRAALRYVTDKDGRAVARDLKAIDQAATVLEAEQALENFAQTWNEKYPTIAKSWREKWPSIITLFEFPAPIRKAISTTNAIESVNSVIRKLTRNRKIYPNAESAFKITDLAIQEASKNWTMPIPQWKAALNHFAILFEGRLPQ